MQRSNWPRISKWPLTLLVMCAAMLGASSAAGASALTSEVQARVSAATFEVVMKKPASDSMQYEEALPLDQQSFAERNDPYLSVGTAFAIGPNTFVSAALVFEAGRISLYGAPVLRDAQGRVYEVDEVEKYASEPDFIVFTLKQNPGVNALDVRRDNQLNERVFSAGNAQGEGVVLRDGLLTSRTPEDVSGRWRWLRFSAAASRGNSGGPLVDAQGRVIGVVLRKSENENLNYALPISVVLDAPAGRAQMGGFFGYQLPVMSAIESGKIDVDFALPKSLPSFYDAITAHVSAQADLMLSQLVARNAATMFPRGAGSEKLLNATPASTGLSIIMLKPDGLWDVFSPNPAATTTATLPNNGSVSIGAIAGGLIVKVRRPDDVEPEGFYRDSDAYVRYILKALALSRMVGQRKIRITSLGPAKKESLFTDSYGRRWQVRTWQLALLDAVLVSYSLPVPDGYVAMIRTGPVASEADANRDLRVMTDFAQTSLSGTLEQWRAYLAQRALLPEVFADIDIHFDYQKSFQYGSARLQLSHPDSLQRVSARSVLTLLFAFFRDGERVVWDVGGLLLQEPATGGQTLLLQRRGRPTEASDADVKTEWQNMLQRKYPMDGSVVGSAGGGASAESVQCLLARSPMCFTR